MMRGRAQSLGSAWIELPQILDDEKFGRVSSALRSEGIAYDSVTFPSGSRYPTAVQHALFLRRDQSKQWAPLLCDVFELEDPDALRPFNGPCPSCDANVVNAWTCPGCGLGFRSAFERDDPLITFVREYGGFDAR